jgi:hypothetical protein
METEFRWQGNSTYLEFIGPFFSGSALDFKARRLHRNRAGNDAIAERRHLPLNVATGRQ